MSNLAMMMGLGSGAGSLNVADVFSTTLYTGTSAEQTITNGIDLAGEGGLVWTKVRDAGSYHYLIDTERGSGKFLFSNDTSAQAENIASISSFNSDGYVLGNMNGLNGSPDNFVSWTWRKAPAFFDCVTFTGDGTSPRSISHNLDSPVGCIIVKRTDTTGNWPVWHRSTGDDYRSGYLNLTNAGGASSTMIRSASSSAFTLGDNAAVNASGGTYVAYLFAHNEDLIQCGSYTGDNSSDGQFIDLGFEPQWLLVKKTSAADNWILMDNVRGMVTSSPVFTNDDETLRPNTSGAEVTSNDISSIDPTGFTIREGGNSLNTISATYIYIAIKAED